MELPAAKRQFSTTSQGKEVSGISAYSPYHQRYQSCPPEVYRRQASSYSVPSSELSRSSVRSSGSFKAAAQSLAGVFSSCFVPRKSRADAEFEISQTTISQGSRSTGYHVSVDSGTGYPQESTELTVAEIFKATSNFSDKNMIRQGSHSSMYRGKLRDGSEIAIKCARKQLNSQYVSPELRRELEILQKIDHKNLVRFLGFFEREDESLTVVEYVSNGSLREHLDESCGNGLELAQRLNVAIDVAHAITYLHEFKEQPIIHRNVRSSNVMLTDTLTAKLGGVGLARMAGGESSESEDTQGKSAAGYVDPEYLSTYELTDKSDVYSFGVLLVELVTGRPPIERRRDLDPRPTTKWALQRFRGGEVVVAMDPRIRRSPASVATVEKVMELAEQCVAAARKGRPSMRRCTEALWSIRREFHRRQDAPAAVAAAPSQDKSSDWVKVV
ncbi:calmodulin-binding receptor-like cytoplasmic kinase 2 isoform X3 [Oryza brachyantha]|uniref:calmodulin-binding receptor-like cytoplasmic kinase 2 isoform X3 n=1 Tax=Oryza brachyantha TaxID=4533 RepID=UPI000776734C|nr:calmodulin-binding receptor-like cytoplasmic kinase 2 isoform X3 [Oryza brachyantha]